MTQRVLYDARNKTNTMKKLKTVKTLSFAVIITGMLVMLGWFLDITALKSVLPFWVTMKFTTALSFVLSGIVLYCTTREYEENLDKGKIVVIISSLGILFLMTTLLASVFLGIRTGIEDLFVKEGVDAIKTTTPGRPSAGTMVNFILIATIGIITVFDPRSYGTLIPNLGKIIAIIGGIAITGYIIDLPLLYYTLEGWSTAMAAHTAILFTMLGIGFAFLDTK